jgi:radical SAM protein with 4Fe4S-binding SPASM domain
MRKTKFWFYYKKNVFKMAFLQAFDNWAGCITKKDLHGNQVIKTCSQVKKYPCKALKTLTVLPNGDLKLCGCRFNKTLKDELVIGNIKKDSLQNLIKNSEKWKEIIKSFGSEKEPIICRRCSFYKPDIF